MGSKTDDIINELTDSLLEDYQEGFQSMDKSEFAFDSVDLLYYHLHKISLKRGKSYIKSPEWLENKRATINLKNDDDSCFQYAAELNYNKFKKRDLRRILNTIQYDRKDIYFSSHLEDWEKFEQSNESIALNILFASHNSEEITILYKSEHNSERKNEVVLLMTNDESKKSYYFAVKSNLELYSSEWLKNKKAAIVNGDACFQNALNYASNYQNIKKDPEKYQILNPLLISITGRE